MMKRLRQMAMLVGVYLCLLSGVAQAQWEFGIWPDNLVLSAPSDYYTVWGSLIYLGQDSMSIRFVSFSDGLVAQGVTIDDSPFYDWVFNDLTDLTLEVQPGVWYPYPLFNIHVDANAPSALYIPTGVLEFDELGGASGVALGATWMLEVQGAPIPEPTTIGTLGVGVALLAMRVRRRRVRG